MAGISKILILENYLHIFCVCSGHVKHSEIGWHQSSDSILFFTQIPEIVNINVYDDLEMSSKRPSCLASNPNWMRSARSRRDRDPAFWRIGKDWPRRDSEESPVDAQIIRPSRAISRIAWSSRT